MIFVTKHELINPRIPGSCNEHTSMSIDKS